MKLTRDEFRNYLHHYDEDEIFYKNMYFEEKDHPADFS